MKDTTIKIMEFSRDEFISLLREAVHDLLPKQTEKEISISNDFLTRQQASQILNVSYTTLFHWNNDNILPARKIGRKVFYLKQDVIDKLNNAA